MASINMTDEQMQAIVAGVITAHLSGEERDRLISAAIASLLDPNKGGSLYNRKPPLAECFERAVYAYAETSCKAFIESHPEVQHQIDEVVAAGFKKALVSDREATINKVASAVSDALYAKAR